MIPVRERKKQEVQLPVVGQPGLHRESQSRQGCITRPCLKYTGVHTQQNTKTLTIHFRKAVVVIAVVSIFGR